MSADSDLAGIRFQELNLHSVSGAVGVGAEAVEIGKSMEELGEPPLKAKKAAHTSRRGLLQNRTIAFTGS
ncbi:hypothetical protein [Bradyrhizobium sp. Gha]|uniref:hypothetical protein n=1 Tax=Bradyrhizobium sp. Gha TaxID=1855318 RepID=UPI000B818177|nr:hypothetical protein [Bradyrhizobium sp. Gha]